MHPWLFTCFLVTACAPDIRGDTDTAADTGVVDTDDTSETDTTDTDTSDTSDTSGGTRVTSTDAGGGVTAVEIDGTVDGVWVHFDFAAAGEVGAAEGWELAFARYDVKVNGGVSGSGGVEVAPVERVAFEAVTAAPATGWRTDTADAYALGDWWDYDSSTHVLTAAPRVYVVRNAAGEAWKLAFVDYCDDAGNPGYTSFRWAELE